MADGLCGCSCAVAVAFAFEPNAELTIPDARWEPPVVETTAAVTAAARPLINSLACLDLPPP